MSELPARPNALRNYLAYTILIACLVGVHFIIAANPSAARSAAQAAVFSWPWLGAIAALGLLGLVFLNLTPLRGLWDRDLGIGAKLFWPLLVGLALGAVNVAEDLATHWSRHVAAEMHLPSIHIAWPLSAPIYFGGAILVSIAYFFVLLPFLYWLIACLLMKGRGEAAVYWIIGSLLALVEPLTQGDLHEIAQGGTVAVPGAVCDLLLNFGQVWLLRRAGLVGAIALRVGYYAVWHVLYGLISL